MTRRSVMRASGLLTLASSDLFVPTISRAADRPSLTHGLQSGDVIDVR
jgi:phosphodiesterase/alkaline phosphatase D-like protein